MVGELARRQSAEMPDRTVLAAKSWLGHSKVDRHQPILPWNAPAEVPKISPVTASTLLLNIWSPPGTQPFLMRRSPNSMLCSRFPRRLIPSARELTRRLARGQFTAVADPARRTAGGGACAWLADEVHRWRKQLKVGDTLLVCDVGGGTTDLTLIGVAEEAGELVLRRIAVGNHLLIGGDNMDLALAYRVSELFAEKRDEARSVAVDFAPRVRAAPPKEHCSRPMRSKSIRSPCWAAAAS